MNAQRRKMLANVSDYIDRATMYLQDVLDEEQDAFDNLPENFQNSERGEQMEEIIELMDEIKDALEDYSGQIYALSEGENP